MGDRRGQNSPVVIHQPLVRILNVIIEVPGRERRKKHLFSHPGHDHATEGPICQAYGKRKEPLVTCSVLPGEKVLVERY